MTMKQLSWLLIAATGLFVLFFVYQRGQDQNWDLLNYHYFSGYAVLHGRFTTDLAPGKMPSFLNPLPNVFSYLVLSALPFPTSAWVLAGVQWLSLPLLVLLCRDIGRGLGRNTPSAAEVLAILLCLAAPVWWSEIGTTFYSSTTAPLVLGGLLYGLRGVTQATTAQPAARAFVLAGMSFGLALGLKLTNAVFAMGFLCALVPVLLPCKARLILRCGLACAAGLAAGFAVTAWWNVLLAWHWGNPLFPLYNAIFQSPYFDKINYRDWHWHFASLSAFLSFLRGAAFRGTIKTLEFPFVDARWLLYATLLLLLVLVAAYRYGVSNQARSWRGEMTSAGKAFLWFFGISFALWALMFAYQRYLIPLELLCGMAVWMLVTHIFRQAKLVVAVLAVCVVVSFTTMWVPDWGHKAIVKDWPNPFAMQPRATIRTLIRCLAVKDRPNPFGLQLPPELTSQPALYLVYSMPISYIFAFLHPDSRFLRVDFAPQTEGLIRQALAHNVTRPVRVLTRETEAGKAMPEWARFGYQPGDQAWFCWHFRSDIDSYVACEVQTPRRVHLQQGG